MNVPKKQGAPKNSLGETNFKYFFHHSRVLILSMVKKIKKSYLFSSSF